MMILEGIPISNFLVDKQMRLLSTIRSRIRSLKFQKRYAMDHVEEIYNWWSDFYLCLKAFDKDIEALNQLCNRLVNNSLFCNTTYLEVLHDFNKFPKSLKMHSWNLLGSYVPRKMNLNKNLNELYYLRNRANPDQLAHFDSLIEKEKDNILLCQKFIESMKKKCLNARKSELLNRLRLEMHLRVKQGWFVVFNTLTVDNHNQERVFDENSSVWTDYVRTVDRAVGISLFGSWRNAVHYRRTGINLRSASRRSFSDVPEVDPDPEFHTYFAVVERGSASGRLHIHVLHFMKGLPNGSCDPNTGRTVAHYREIAEFKKFWKYGFSSPIAVRFDMSDAYSKLYWRWPVKKENGQYISIKVSNPDAMVFYIGKYMTKEFDKSINRKEIRWRTKMSQSLGKTICQMIVNQANEEQLETILRIRSSNVLQFREKNLPLWTMKKLAMKRIFQLKKKQIPKSFWTTLQELRPQDSFMKHVKLMIRKKDTPSPLNFGNTRALTLLSTVGSSLTRLVKEITDQVFGFEGLTIFSRGSTCEVRCG